MARRLRSRYGLVVGRFARWMAGAAALVVAAALGLALVGYWNARADPMVRRAAVSLPHWPRSAAPVTVALLGDVHVGSPAMDADRLARIVARVNALHPDLVLIAGDFVFGHDPANGARYAAMLTAPLSRLRAPLGVVAVLGNHDHWTAPAAIAGALRRAGITVLVNSALERGPLAIVGVDDAFSGHADLRRALRAGAALPGAPVVLTHSPDLIARLPAGSAPLVLTAHTHCGQVVVPLTGWMVTRSPLTGQTLFDPRYRCGMVRDHERRVIVTAGLGTSVAPVRFNAPPDVWMIRVGP